MQIELTIFEALQSVNIPYEKARAVADSFSKEFLRQQELHTKQMASQADIERVIGKIETLRGDLHKLVIDSQRWILAVLFGGLAALAAIQKMI